MANIDESLPFILANEGGFSNDPADRGGATQFGITRAVLAAYRNKPVSIEDVKNLKREEAAQIYKTQYWNPLNLDKVQKQAMATAIFDMSVNRGPRTAAKMAQRALNECGYKLAVDGSIGVFTLSALNRVDPVAWMKAFQSIVEQGYYSIVRANPSQKRFIKGWINRARRLLTLITKPLTRKK